MIKMYKARSERVFLVSYPSKHVLTLYKISAETLRKWTLEFRDYLSPTANPGAHKSRFYTIDDLQVISLISEQKNMGFKFEEIHANLQSGQRGVAPEIEPAELDRIVKSGDASDLALMNAHLRHNLALAQETLQKAEKRLELLQEAQQAKAVAEAQLETLKESHEREVDGLRQSITELNDQLRKMAQDSAQQYSKGFQEGWQLRGNNDGSE